MLNNTQYFEKQCTQKEMPRIMKELIQHCSPGWRGAAVSRMSLVDCSQIQFAFLWKRDACNTLVPVFTLFPSIIQSKVSLNPWKPLLLLKGREYWSEGN